MPRRTKSKAKPKPAGRKETGRRNLARLLTLLDDGDPRGLEQLARIEGGSLPYMVGVTGAAGVGKSLLLARIVERETARLTKSRGGEARGEFQIGVLAVDPSHPDTGGALLGDRVRMPALAPHVFFRSVATRGATGGLSEKLIDMAAAMQSFGCEIVFVETVGIGQDELSIRQVADTLIVVEAPGLGDDIQAMKSSPAAVADILVVNKADKSGAAETAAILQNIIGKKPILTSAVDGDGTTELEEVLAGCRTDAMRTDVKKAADRRKWTWRLAQALTKRWSDRISAAACEIVSTLSFATDIYRRIGDLARFSPDHVAVAVENMDRAVADYQKLGFFLERREVFAAEGVETAFFNAGGFHIELLRPLSPASPVAKFVAERGGGLHHVAFEIADLAALETELKSKGVEMIGGRRAGTRGKQILFLHPKSASRVLLEFCSCDMHTRKTTC